MVEDPSPCYKLLALHMMANITDSKQLDVLEFLAKCSGPRRSFLCFNRNKQILLIKMNFHWDFLVRLAPIPLWSLTITYLVGFSHLKLSFSFFFIRVPDLVENLLMWLWLLNDDTKRQKTRFLIFSIQGDGIDWHCGKLDGLPGHSEVHCTWLDNGKWEFNMDIN